MNLSTTDMLCLHLDQFLKTTFTAQTTPERNNPADDIDEVSLSPLEQKRSAALMRVNHSGEVCAQALYLGQATTTCNQELKADLLQTAKEENDHLSWCASRIAELGSVTSYLNPLWYLGSYTIGGIVGLLGDRLGLGFVAETEHQVVTHLDGHLQQLPTEDQKSRAIVGQMQQDEHQHACQAMANGARELPGLVKTIMRRCAQVMTTTAYYI